jgi:hypothetical protein
MAEPDDFGLNPGPHSGGHTHGRVPGPLGTEVEDGWPFGHERPLGSNGGDVIPLDQAPARTIDEPAPVKADRSWGILLKRVEKPLFDQQTKVDEVKQGSIYNCALPAVLAAMVHTGTLNSKIKITPKTDKAKSKFSDPSVYPDSNKTAELAKDETKTTFEVEFPGKEKTEVTNFFWSSTSNIEYGRSTANAIWVSVIEKAFVVLKASASYETLADANKGPDGTATVAFLTGSVTVHEVAKLKDPELIKVLQAAAKTPTYARFGAPDANMAHAYAVLGMKGTPAKVELYDALGQRRVERTLADFRKAYDFIVHP